jgi:hypothetical protein
LDGLSPEIAAALRSAAALAPVVALAKTLGLSALTVAIALLAQAEVASDRHAARIARSVLASGNLADVKDALDALGL